MTSSGPDRLPSRLFAVLFATGLIGSLLGAPSSATAYNLVDNEELELNLSALGEAGYTVREPVEEDEDLEYGPFVSLARLKVDTTLKDYAELTLQTGVRNGDVVLLDAVVAFTAAEPFTLKAGQFKSPVSREFLIGAPDLLFYSRAGLRRYVPGRRIGSQAEYAIDAGDNLTITPQVGFFQPPDGSITAPAGASIVGRLLVEPGDAVDIHVAGAEFVLDENNARNPQNPNPGYEQIIDAAVTYDTKRWNLHAEGVYVTGPQEDVDYAAGGYAHVGHRLGDLDGISYEPALGYDIFGYSNETANNRITGGLNVYINGPRLIASADYRLRLYEQGTGHAGVVQLQAKL